MIFPRNKNIKKIEYKIKNKLFKSRNKRCEVCHSYQTLKFQNCGKIGNKPGIYGYLPIKICKVCSLKFISPRPSNNFYKKFFNLDYGASYFGAKFKPNKNHIKFQRIRGYLIFKYFKNFIKKKEKILDHGCSTGLTMIPWKKDGFKINGIDPHRPSVNYGNEKYGLTIDFAFGEKLPYKQKSFGAVISLGSLEHCFDISQSLKEIYRVLKLNGKLIIRWRSDKLIGSPLEYFNYNTLKFLNREAWEFILNKNNFYVKKFINTKIEKYDSFEYIIAEKKKLVKATKKKNFYLNQIYKHQKHINYYEKLCLKIKKENLYKKSISEKKKFIIKYKIGLMNIGKKKSIERFFNETQYYLNFISKLKKK